MSSPTIKCKCGRVTNYGLTCVSCREIYSIARDMFKDETEDEELDLYTEFEEAGFEITSLDEEYLDED